MRIEKTITQEIEIDIQTTNKGIICNNYFAVWVVWGSQVAVTDLVRSGLVEKTEDGLLITKKALKERIAFMENKIKKYSESLDIMKKAIQ